MAIIPTIPHFEVATNPNVFGNVVDVGAAKRIAKREKITSGIETGLILAVAVITTAVSFGAGGAAVAALTPILGSTEAAKLAVTVGSAIAVSTATSVTQVSFEAATNRLSEETAKDVGINFGVAIFTLGAAKVIRAGSRIIRDALQYREL